MEKFDSAYLETELPSSSGQHCQAVPPQGTSVGFWAQWEALGSKVPYHFWTGKEQQ